jgi:tol-pal system protein YbgF
MIAGVRGVLLLCALGLSPLAQAGLFDDDEARRALERLRVDTDTRLQKLEASQRAQLDLFNQIEQLKADLAKVRGQIEVIGYELESTQKRQRDFYVDLDTRLRKQETGLQEVSGKLSTLQAEAAKAADQAAERLAATTRPPVASEPDAASEAKDYEAALTLLKAAKYREAAAALQAFIKNYPNSTSQASANYWAASAFYQAREPLRAADFYERVAARWPEDARAPDALLGLANCEQDQGEPRAARKTLEHLIAKYPNSNAAQIARQQLKKK